ncbi:transcription factor EGL1-like isoform X2 [Malania oleifera]|uniref:transcription factor EGL1-like isoform X2 n=1 Tax=Malania oleifera TaxID=397392 RepID=UPI0025AE8BAF|nr:transcription factor EGL1-like isoform X2 [Malania oleifera]
MATVHQTQEGVPENLRKQLALAVRSIQWSYAIFWSISSRQPGVLEWGEGYYNGDIKTRKTVQAIELNSDQIGLQRSEQLRELYESLSASESNPQARRPSAALSPEDLSDTEWYYLVCMSFVFNVGQGLPGRTLANGRPIWLSNAHLADSKVFGRSLLAKLQTVACFPFLGGVVELGVTELFSEDLNLIRHIKTTFLEMPYAIVSKNSSSLLGNPMDDNDPLCTEFDCKILDTTLNPIIECEIGSPNNGSNGIGPTQQGDESFMVEGINGGASQVQSWHFMDDEFSNGIHNSVNSSDCISQTFVNPDKIGSIPFHERVNDHCLLDPQECNHMKLTPLDVRNDDVHYQGVLSTLLKSSQQLILGPYFRSRNKESSFVSWKKEGLLDTQKPRDGTSQKLLKKILFEVAQMHGSFLLKFRKNDGNKDDFRKPEVDETGVNHMLSERSRREKINERFMILKALVPSTRKVDKVSILDDTIDYLKELKRRVDDLEWCRQLTESEARTKAKPQDTMERIFDDSANDKIDNEKKQLMNKRKARDGDEVEPEMDLILPNDGLTNEVNVRMIERDVLIEMKCQWREGLLLLIMDALSNLHLDCYSVQSSTLDGILTLTIKSKFKGSAVVSVGMLRQALWSVVHKC